jgi:hypothetical protein
MRTLLLVILASALAAQCTSVTAPPSQAPATDFTIVLDSQQYTQDKASTWGIRAAVTNTSKDANFFANVGDAMGVLDQPVIFAAKGTHAIIERQVSRMKWVNANAGALIEGGRQPSLGQHH